MRRHLGYLLYVLTHKWYVYRAGRMLGLGRWQLLMHDASKFSPEEWSPYAHRFYDRQGRARVAPKSEAFALAVHHHRRRNRHHPQYWERPGGKYPFRMPGKHVIEMVADWAGAGRAKTGRWDIQEWANDALPRMNLHPGTETSIRALLAVLKGRLS